MKFSDIKKFTSVGNYQINSSWSDFDRQIAHYREKVGKIAPLDLDPDFQRGRVWTPEQKTSFVEYGLKGGKSGMILYFNCVGWMSSFKGPFVVVDGKQRIDAVLSFLNNKVPAFGAYYSEFEDCMRSLEPCFLININNLKTRAEVLEWYIQLNTGGVLHSKEELDRVRFLLEKDRLWNGR